MSVDWYEDETNTALEVNDSPDENAEAYIDVDEYGEEVK